jgi:hypothetical protein
MVSIHLGLNYNNVSPRAYAKLLWKDLLFKEMIYYEYLKKTPYRPDQPSSSQRENNSSSNIKSFFIYSLLTPFQGKFYTPNDVLAVQNILS